MTLAVGLLSGGLDSAVAIEAVRRMGIDVILVHCLTGFSPTAAEPPAAVQAADNTRIVDISEELLEIIKNPPHGLGRGMNPCIDCHILMLRHAGKIMQETGAAFVFTGEVIGQRPMSQNRQAILLIERESGLEGRLLRPLSGKLLPPTEPEKAGLINRDMLLDIEGRSRKRQLALAKAWGIKDYRSPAGGCLLTDPAFAFRLKELLEHNPDASLNDVQLLKVGRHFRLDDGTCVIIGRHQADNERLETMTRPGDIIVEAADIPGPLTVIRGEASEENIECACRLTLRYAGAAADNRHRCTVRRLPDAQTTQEAEPMADEEARRWLIAKDKADK